MDIIQGAGATNLPGKIGNSPVIAIPKGETIYLDCISFPDHDKATISIKLNCAGNPIVQVEFEQGFKEPNKNAPDDSFSVPDDAQPLFPAGIADKKQHHAQVKIGDLQYGRLKLTEQAGLEDTTATIFISSKG